MHIGRLIPGTQFMYSDKRYQVLRGVHGPDSRFRIQEKVIAERALRYQEMPDQIYAYCFDTGTLGTFKLTTSVKPVPLLETVMTDSPGQPDTSRRDALLEVIVCHKALNDKLEVKNKAEAERHVAQEKLDTAKDRAHVICGDLRAFNVMVKDNYVIRVTATGITIEEVEILE